MEKQGLNEATEPRKPISKKVSSLLPSDFFNLCTYKLVFLFLYGAFGSMLIYLPLYFKYRGLDAAQVGVLTGIRPFMQAIGAPIAGFLADKYKRRKLIMFISISAFLLKHLGLLLVPRPHRTCLRVNTSSGLYLNTTNATFRMESLNLSQADFGVERIRRHNDFLAKMVTTQRISKERMTRHNEFRKEQHRNKKREERKEDHDEKTTLRLDTTRSKRQITTNRLFDKNNHHTTKTSIVTDQTDTKRQFILFLFIIIVFELIGSSMLALLDASAVEYLGEERNDYGKFRLWGSLGICTASITIGAVIQQNLYLYCDTLQKEYRILFYFLFGFSFLGLLAFVNTKHVYAEAKTKTKIKSDIWKIKKIFTGIKNMSFWMTLICLGIIDGFQMDFGPWFLDDLGARSDMIGMATSLHFVVNALTYLVSNHIINKLGYMNTLSVGLLLYAFVFTLFSFARSSWFAIALFALVGSVSTLTWSCGITYVAMVSDPIGIVSTAEGLLNGMYTGIGISFGTIIGGVIIKVIDIRTAFRVDAALAILAVLVLNALLWIDRHEKKQEEAAYKPLEDSGDE